MTRESKYDPKVVLLIQLQEQVKLDCHERRRRMLTHTKAESILPIMVIRRIFLRPYLSDRDPMYGDTRN